MSEVRSYERSLARSNESLTRPDRPRSFTMAGREWDLLEEVFAPLYSPSTGIALDFLGLAEPVRAPHRGSLLEIGCGTGVIAVTGALAGRDRVVAADINPMAVANAGMNAARHHVADRVRAVHSDLFSALAGEEPFDVVFWSSNYVLAPEDYTYRTMHERAYVDPGYTAHRRFLTEVPRWVAPGGLALLHFSSRGDVEGLRVIADECGRRLTVRRTRAVREGDHMVEHLLIEVTEAPARR
ncbi:methyltransferase domain-containing protein [Wenjunlia tyrosinilytica]|uniref:methyltransferase domain-containing protein n=1 Tax=Wenjunlia tyrosinilytica TaxID=1544741 RepID=UPI001E5545A6|nr:methyltransferase domain-containing protein [Wenjunlia tyrosinilytica]